MVRDAIHHGQPRPALVRSAGKKKMWNTGQQDELTFSSDSVIQFFSVFDLRRVILIMIDVDIAGDSSALSHWTSCIDNPRVIVGGAMWDRESGVILTSHLVGRYPKGP